MTENPRFTPKQYTLFLHTGAIIAAFLWVLLSSCKPEAESPPVVTEAEQEEEVPASEELATGGADGIDDGENADGVINKRLESYARNFSFAHRQISIAQHPILGKLSRPAQLSFREKEVHQKIQATRFWNDLNFDAFGLEPLPAPPFRSVRIGEISLLGAQRYEVLVELISFDAAYLLGIVLYADSDHLSIVLMRHL